MKRTIAAALTIMALNTQVHAGADPPKHTVHLPIVATAHPAETVTEKDAAETKAIHNYIQHVSEDGDYLNDWLTHVRPSIQDALEALGRSIEGSRRDRFTFAVVFEGETSDQTEFLRGWAWARSQGYSSYQAMWIGMGEVLDNHLEEDVMQAVWLVIEEQCVN